MTDLDCVVGCWRLVRQEAILAGGSSGAVISAVERAKERIECDATCVAILADRGERYLDTIYSGGWVRQHFGDDSNLWGIVGGGTVMRDGDILVLSGRDTFDTCPAGEGVNRRSAGSL